MIIGYYYRGYEGRILASHLAVADLERIVLQGLQYSYFAIPCNATVRAERLRFLLHAVCKQPLIFGASWDRGSGTRASRTGRIETRQGARYVYIHIYIYIYVCVCVCLCKEDNFSTMICLINLASESKV